jgi:hypothetical protein
MQEAIQKMGRVAPPLLTLVAAGAFLGTLGVVLPGILGSMRWLTPATAAVVVIMLLCSTIFHIKYRDKPKIFVSIVLAVFAACITYGRWMLLP